MEASTLHPQQETLLIVDDEPLMTDLFRQFMSRQGYRVLTAHGGQEALAIVDTEPEPICLVVMDQTMPDMDGLETARRLLERAPTIPVLITSGMAANATPDLPANIVGTVQKPFRNQALAERIRLILEKTCKT